MATLKTIRLAREIDTDPDLSYLEQDYNDISIPAEEAVKYRQQDAERLAAYNRNEWSCIGIYAEALLEVQGVLQKVRTAGVWGIESDGDDDYDRSEGVDELDALKDILLDLGIGWGNALVEKGLKDR